MGASARPTTFCRQVTRKRLPGWVPSLMPSHGYADRHKCIRAGDVLFLLAIIFDKCSVLLLVRRLFAPSQHQKRLLCKITIGLCAVWWLCSTLAITIDCISSSAIHSNAGMECPGLVQLVSTTSWGILADHRVDKALGYYRSARCGARSFHLGTLLGHGFPTPDELENKVEGIRKLRDETTVRFFCQRHWNTR